MTRRDLPEASGPRGASLGRAGEPASDPNATWTVTRIPLDGGGYDEGGAYWGLGDPVWCASEDGGAGEMFVRAPDFPAAARQVRERYPNALPQPDDPNTDGPHLEGGGTLEPPDLPEDAIDDLSQPGDVWPLALDWRERLGFTVDREAAIDSLEGYGAWDRSELESWSDEHLAATVLCLAAGDFANGDDLFCLE